MPFIWNIILKTTTWLIMCARELDHEVQFYRIDLLSLTDSSAYWIIQKKE